MDSLSHIPLPARNKKTSARSIFLLTRGMPSTIQGPMSDLFMVRHGQASFGSANYDVLSENGIAQARICGEYLAEIGLRFDALYAWKMERQVETAREIVAAFRRCGVKMPDLRLHPALSEYGTTSVLVSYVPEVVKEDPSLQSHVERLYTDKRSFQKVFEAVIVRWVEGRHPMPGVEPWEVFSSRVREGIHEIMAAEGRGKKLLLVTSGGPIGAVLEYALSLTPETAIRLSWQIANTSVTRFMYNDDRITLAGFNSLAHLEMKDRGLITYR